MAFMSSDAAYAIIFDKDGNELQMEDCAAPGAVGREFKEIPLRPTYDVMTIEIRSLGADKSAFDERIKLFIGVPGDKTQGWYYTQSKIDADTPLRYVFDTSLEIPLDAFGRVIKDMTRAVPSRCQTMTMTIVGGCTGGCRPKTCNGQASCGFKAGCPC